MPFSHARRSRTRRRLILARRQELSASILGRASLEFIHDCILNERPLNWVLTGERYPVDRGGLSISEELGVQLRTRHGRDDDSIINTAVRDDTMETLENSLDDRVWRHDPSVVAIMVGRCDDQIEQRLLDCQTLGRIIMAVTKQHAVPVVVPPPGFLTANNESLLGRWRNDIVDIAAAHDALLVPSVGCHQPRNLNRVFVQSVGLDQLIFPTPAAAVPATSEILPISR